MSLRERRDVVALCRSGDCSGGVLFTVIGVSGSSYRRPGAHMVALADGRAAGILSGGCLEAELLRRAAWTVRNGAAVEHFSTAFDDSADIPYGLGCGGEIDILAEPLGTPETEALVNALEATLHGHWCTLATSLPGRNESFGALPFARAVFLDGQLVFASDAVAEGPAAHLLLACSGPGITADAIGTVSQGVFLEHLVPAQRLVIFGAGDDARPLVRLGAELGFSVIVADSRADRARPGRFPQAEAVLFAQSAGAVPVRREDAVVLMTHSYEQDRRLLTELLPLAPRYLGLLGARHRSALLLNDACDASGVLLADAVESTHAPVGLELGGDGPEAVALAIIAELQHTLALSGRDLRARRLTLAQVQALLQEDASVPYSRDACALFLEAPAA